MNDIIFVEEIQEVLYSVYSFAVGFSSYNPNILKTWGEGYHRKIQKNEENKQFIYPLPPAFFFLFLFFD